MGLQSRCRPSGGGQMMEGGGMENSEGRGEDEGFGGSESVVLRQKKFCLWQPKGSFEMQQRAFTKL